MSDQEESEVEFTHIIDGMVGYELIAIVDSVIVRADGPIGRKMLGWQLNEAESAIKEQLPGRCIKKVESIYASSWIKSFKEPKANNESEDEDE